MKIAHVFHVLSTLVRSLCVWERGVDGGVGFGVLRRMEFKLSFTGHFLLDGLNTFVFTCACTA